MFLVSILLLVVNDHVLKDTWPGFVTGKLSDVAGVAMVAIGLTALVRRPAIAFAITALGFGLLKTVPIAAVWAAPMLGGVTRTDPSDALALGVLVPLWGWVKRPVTSASQRSAWLLPVRIVAVGCAVFATTATSCEGEGVLGLATLDGVIYAITVTDAYESADGGATWRLSSLSGDDQRFARRYPDTLTDCIGPADCVEIVDARSDGLAVLTIDVVQGAERRSILAVTAAERRALLTVVNAPCGDGIFHAISAVDRADGEHAVVAMGAAGVLHHRPDQTWEWVTVGGYGLRSDQVADEPFGFTARSIVPTSSWDRWPVGLVTLLLALGPVSVAFAIIPITRLARRHHRDPAVGIVTCVVVAAGLGVVSLFVFTFVGGFGDRGDAAVGSVFVALAAVGTVAPLLGWYGRPRRPGDWRPPDPARRIG